jgi:hypothetical protein
MPTNRESSHNATNRDALKDKASAAERSVAGERGDLLSW